MDREALSRKLYLDCRSYGQSHSQAISVVKQKYYSNPELRG